MISRVAVALLFVAVSLLRAAAPDTPFLQDRSEQFPAEGELAGAAMRKVHVNKDGIVYVLTDRGMARLFGSKLAVDRSFRPLNDRKIVDTVLKDGEVYYLLEDSVVCNGFAGTNSWKIAPGTRPPMFDPAPRPAVPSPRTSLAVTNITVEKHGWFGTTRGICAPGRYYASRRWLLDDHVIDLDVDKAGNLYVLTKSGLNKIVFEPMTLEKKAAHYQRKIRERHIRFGFCSELRLLRPGDITSAEMIDTDNDGTWSNYYMASQAFRFGATGDVEAHAHAWETFAALERLEKINSLGGFPARTFERIGYKFSDIDRWRDAGDGLWEWKGHTSSDEIAAHTFGSSVLYEACARTSDEKARIAAFIDKVASHIIRNNWYLIDVDGKPTLWARWHPEYVNWFPASIVDRRLNSAEIVGLMQFAYAITGKAIYKEKGMELLEKHGYLENIVSSMKLISLTRGYVHEGNDMGNEWNHSDDLLSFVSYWFLHRYAFTGELKKKYAEAIRDHWEIEKHEKNPLWSFVYASTKPKEYDLAGALWTLRRFPWDMTDWTVENSHRADITRLPANFREQQLEQLLPPGERRITRWNSQPFVLDGGSGGQIELAGDEFLLPYWMGRYLKIIEPPKSGSKRPAALP